MRIDRERPGGYSDREGVSGMKKAWLMIVVLSLILTGCAGREQVFDLNADRIRSDTVYLCRDIGIRVTETPEEAGTADWIFESLLEAGFEEEKSLRRQIFTGARGGNSENVIAVCNPDCDGSIISVVAHFDSVATSLGARDNAASVAGLLEMARYLGSENEGFPCQIRLVFLGSEENGYHGSGAYVAELTEAEKARHLGAFNMDISAASDEEEAQLVCNNLGAVKDGQYREGNFIVPAEGALTDAIRQAYRELYGKNLGGVFHFGESDHVSFHNAEIEAVNVCWRKVYDGMPVLPESYHKMEDTPEELNYETIRASARCILRAIEILTTQ